MEWILNLLLNNVIDLLSSGLDFGFSLTDFAQTQTAGGMGDLTEAVDKHVFVSPLTNSHVLGLSEYMMDKAVGHANKMTGVARALGAVFAVIVAGKEAYKVMAEQRGFDILDILRPLLFAFVLAFWGPVVNTVMAPGYAVEKHCQGLYASQCARIDSLRLLRLKKSTTIAFDIKKQTANVKQQDTAEKQEGNFIKKYWNDVKDFFSDPGTSIGNAVMNLGMTFLSTIEALWWSMVERIIIWIGELFFTIAIYIVFILKALFITVLSMFGPLYMAASILPAWKEAWKQWVERMVHASLFGGMGYLAMAFSMHLISYCLEQDIKALETIVTSEGSIMAFLQFSAGGLGTVATTAIAYFVGAFAMKAVPEMAAMVFPGGHSMAATSFISGMQGQVTSTASGAVKMGAQAAAAG